ncbi:MAG: hypothetical protein K6F52_06755 [Clostridia bacterium]|nr:hypothetical protein [Clostridia bacterium]
MDNKFKIDSRTSEDIYKEIDRLAKSYTPEWKFDTENPDIGSTIGMIFAEQLSDNIRKTNQVMERYRVEFVNLLDLSILPAIPAEGTVVMKTISPTVEGTYVPAGTKLMGTSENGNSIVFETDQTMYVASVSIDYVMGLSKEQGKIIPYLGQADRINPLRESDYATEEPAESGEETVSGQDEYTRPLYLFDYRNEGVSQNTLVIYHDSIFDVGENGRITLRFLNLANEEYPNLADPQQYSWKYYRNGRLENFENVSYADGCFILETDNEIERLSIRGKEYQCIAIEAEKPFESVVSVDKIEMASEAEDVIPEFICYDNTQLDTQKFYPFGETAALYSECYIAENRILGQRGSVISLDFDLEYTEKLVTMTPEAEEAELKIIKRKRKTVFGETYRTKVEKVVFEYFNNKGWVKLDCSENYEELFKGDNEGHVHLEFECPDDMAPFQAGGYEGRLFRIRIVQADNCYLMPCYHTMPLISNMRLAYKYSRNWQIPVFADTVTGRYKKDITLDMAKDESAKIFEPVNVGEEALAIGLTKRPQGEPFSLYFLLNDNTNYRSKKLKFLYSSLSGFKQMKVIDLTDGLRKSGLIMMIAPSDFAAVEIEGVRRFWIKIVDEEETLHRFDNTNPYIRHIYINGINIVNREKMQEIDLFLDNTEANAEFSLPYENILNADVFVNERNSLSLAEMQELQQKFPNDVRTEYDYLGNMRNFFVRWSEVQNFDCSKPEDRHYVLDRMSNTLKFGNGVNVRIPQANRMEPTLKVSVSCCNGEEANLPSDAVTNPVGRIPFIGTITNPAEITGGSNIERYEAALKRGSGIFSSKNRMVSYLDFEREAISNFSQIHSAKCVSGMDFEGTAADNEITMVVLTKEYKKGTRAFEGIAEKLREKLLTNNEYVLNKVNIVEPVFVKLEADIWINTDDYEHIFDIQNNFLRELNEFIDPITGCYGNGWEIGRLPAPHQLRLIMKRAENNVVVRYYTITASYQDRDGWHEVDYNEMKPTPFMIAVNGQHKVQILGK